jgi:hypothetical protein
MAARRSALVERLKFLMSERSEFEKFQWSEQRPQVIFCQPSPFRPFWGCQNGHPTRMKAPKFGRSAYRVSQVETDPADLGQLVPYPKTTSHHWIVPILHDKIRTPCVILSGAKNLSNERKQAGKAPQSSSFPLRSKRFLVAGDSGVFALLECVHSSCLAP